MKRLWLFIAFVFWAVFTLALLTWWVVFSFRQLDSLNSLNLASDNEILRHQKMLMYEGITLYVCLVVGAAALIYFIFKENKALRERKDFLSLFTHDLKTTISSLRLMLERLSLKVSEPSLKSEVREIQQIGTRLNQQLQNALQASYENDRDFVFEEIDFCEQINYIRSLWPDLSFKIEDGLDIYADTAAVRSISLNLIQNALMHAQATEVVFAKNTSRKGYLGISCSTPGARKLPVSIEDFRSNLRAFQSIDGSGIGLKLTKDIMTKMGGAVSFDLSDEGVLVVTLFFKNKEARS